MKAKLHPYTSLCSLLILAFSATTALATTYYIDPSAADDSDDGLSLSTPWKDFDVAFDGGHVQAGDTVILRGGVYRPNPSSSMTQHFQRELVTSWPDFLYYPGTAISGTPGHMITLKAYQNEKPILKGSLVIDSGSWTHVPSTNVYWTSWVQPGDDTDHRFGNCQQVFVSNNEDETSTSMVPYVTASLRQISWPSTSISSDVVTYHSQYYGIGNPATSSSN